jgi:hypothetical protein
MGKGTEVRADDDRRHQQGPCTEVERGCVMGGSGR